MSTEAFQFNCRVDVRVVKPHVTNQNLPSTKFPIT